MTTAKWMASFLAFAIAACSASAAESIRKSDVFELTLTAGKEYSNPYLEGLPADGQGLVRANFVGTEGSARGKEYMITGFWDGGKTWRIRFAPPFTGAWRYKTISEDSGLNGKEGSLSTVDWTADEKRENPTRRGFIQVNGTGERAGRYFVYADGTPFLWIGDTWWNWTKRGIAFESFKKMADDRAAKGFTVGQLFCAANGWGKQASLLDVETFSVLDIGHMQHVESLIRYANSIGITVWIHGWWSRKNLNEHVGAEKIKRWWRYLVHRLGAYNVIWTLAGEYNMNNYGGFSLDFWKDLGALVDKEDPYGIIISLHPTPPGWDGGAEAPQWSTGQVQHRQPWLDYNQSQVGHGKWRNEMIPGVIRADYNREPAKPTVVTEPWYEFILGDPEAIDVRFAAWSAILSGAAGHTYGGGHVWKAHVPEAPQGADSWPMDLSFETNTLDYPGALGMSHLARFFKDIEWWRLSPHPEIVHDYSEPYCLADQGREYVVYLRWGGAAKIDLAPSSAGDMFAFKWFNPASGEYSREGEIEGGARYFYAPRGYPSTPGFQDWILHIKRK